VGSNVTTTNYSYSTLDLSSADTEATWGGSTDSPIYEPPSWAVVPEFNEAFVAYGGLTEQRYATATGLSSELTVEDRDFAVGEGAPYDETIVALQGAWPGSKYIALIKGRLWAANLSDQPFALRWSAPVPYHKVWPSLSRERLMEDDNSPITGLTGFQEQPVIFKNDSIWIMVDRGLDEFDLRIFTPVRVVAGTGCVSNSSMKQIRGRLVFLAEDGIYAFDGTPNIKKISERIQSYIDRITPGRRAWSVAAHWRTKSMYLLSVPLDGSLTNTHVLAYDYKNDSWWVWDNIPVHAWIQTEQNNDSESLYFAGGAGTGIFLFNSGLTDDGSAVTASFTTHRQGFRDNTTKVFRRVDTTATNKLETADVSVYTDDDDINNITTGEPDFNDFVEKDYGTFSYNSGASTDDNWNSERTRTVGMGFRKTGEWANVKVLNDTKNTKLQCAQVDLGYNVKSKR
jgi:hypothetical protein